MFDTRYWILDAQCLIPDTGFSILDFGRPDKHRGKLVIEDQGSSVQHRASSFEYRASRIVYRISRIENRVVS